MCGSAGRSQTLGTSLSCLMTVEMVNGVEILTNFILTSKDIERCSIVSSVSVVDSFLLVEMLVLSYINNDHIFMRCTAFPYVKRHAMPPSPPCCLSVCPSWKSCLSVFL